MQRAVHTQARDVRLPIHIQQGARGCRGAACLRLPEAACHASPSNPSVCRQNPTLAYPPTSADLAHLREATSELYNQLHEWPSCEALAQHCGFSLE